MNYQGEGAQSAWSGLRIEVQLRTKVQHAWATALETVDTFTRQALKSNVGDPDWMRFFALMGAEVAHREGQPLVPETPATTGERREELRHLAKKHNIVERLNAYGQTVQILERETIRRDDRHFLLDLDIQEGQLGLRTYANAAAAAAAAEEAYGVLEAEAGDMHDIVLVAVSSMAALQRAYPNYFLDTTSFVQLVNDALRR